MSNLVVLLDEYIKEYKEKDKDFNRYGDTVVKELKNDFSQKSFKLSFEYIRAKLEEANNKQFDANHGHRYYKRYYGILMGFALWLIDKGEYKATDKAEMQVNRKMFERLPSWSSPRKEIYGPIKGLLRLVLFPLKRELAQSCITKIIDTRVYSYVMTSICSSLR